MIRYTRLAVFLLALSTTLSAGAAKSPHQPAPTKPIGNANAPQGGTFNINFKAEPTTLNPITGTDLYGQRLTGLVCDSLMGMDPDTYEWQPGLAERAEMSEDGKTYTFFLRKDGKFHDGKPITAEDVKFSFDVWFDPKYNAVHMRPYYEDMEKAEVIDPYTIKFTMKKKYFRNFDTLAGTEIYPKHVYGDAEKGKKMNKTILCSGRYKLDKYDQGQSILLVKNKDYWGFKEPVNKGLTNFDRIRIRFVTDDNIILESLKKGDIDFYEDLTNESYAKKAVGPEWGKSVFKVKTENLAPKSYGFVGFNLRRDLFKERDLRLALYHLFNRKEMNAKFRDNMSYLATGPWYQQSEYANPDVKPIEYDPKKATELLKKLGWTDSDKNGILDKTVDGKKQELRFTLTYGNKDTEKYWVMFQEDLKKVGIDMQLQRLEWNALMKVNDDGNFDALAMGWGAGSVKIDPKQVWHSQNAVKGGSNFVGYKNPEVDKMIDEARAELDKEKRKAILRKVYKTIADDVPYLFMFNDKYVLYANSAKMKKVKDSYKFAIVTDTWWHTDVK